LEGEPQVVVKNVEDIEVLEIADLQALSPQTQGETVQHLSDLHAQKSFDLNTGPVFKAKLLQLSEQKNVLLINMGYSRDICNLGHDVKFCKLYFQNS
jgi:hypothetical protein